MKEKKRMSVDINYSVLLDQDELPAILTVAFM